MLTPSQRDSLLAQLRSHYNGVKVDYLGYPGECVSYVRRWLDVIINGHMNGPMVSPPAPGGANGYGAYYWSQPTDAIRNLFDVVNYDPNTVYPSGSLFTNSGTGHVGIMLDNQPGQPTALVSEQNADSDGSPVHDAQRPKSRINGILVLKLAADAPLWTVQLIAPKEVQVQPGHNKWNLGHPDFASVAANPIELSTNDTRFTARAILHHREIPQYNYYLEDPNTPHGWNVLDCMDYVAPPTPAINPIPSVINTPTPTVPQAEKYTLVTTLVYFPTAEDAKQRTPKAIGPIFEGTYYVVGRDAQAIKLSKDNKTDIGWINSNDNRLPIPEPIQPVQPTLPVDPPKVINEPVDINQTPVTPAISMTDVKPASKEITWGWLNPNHSPTIYRYKGTAPVPIKDLEGSKPSLTMNAGLQGPISRYTVINNTTYLIPDAEFKKGNAYGIPEMLMAPVHENILTEVEQDVISFWDNFEELPKKVYTLISDISPVKRHEVIYKGRQFIDGFKKGSKK